MLRPGTWELICASRVKTQPGIRLAVLAGGSGRQPHTCKFCSARASTWARGCWLRETALSSLATLLALPPDNRRWHCCFAYPSFFIPYRMPSLPHPSKHILEGIFTEDPFPLKIRSSQLSTVMRRDHPSQGHCLLQVSMPRESCRAALGRALPELLWEHGDPEVPCGGMW